MGEPPILIGAETNLFVPSYGERGEEFISYSSEGLPGFDQKKRPG